MADIREHYEGQGNNSFLRARSSERMADKIAVEALSKKLASDRKEESQALGIPVWLLEARQAVAETPSYKPEIKLWVKGNGDLYYKDSDGCTIELPSDAKKMAHFDEMLLVDFIKEV
jgi:hypothetical protein